MLDPILNRVAMNDLVSQAAINAIQAEILDELRIANIQLKNVPKLRQFITEALSTWSRSAEDLPKIRSAVLDRIRGEVGMWERIK